MLKLKATPKKTPFKKKRDNSSKRVRKLAKYLQSELATSTTHGLPYIVNKELHWFERVFWSLSFMLSTAVIFMLLTAQYRRFVQAPTVMSVEMDYFNWNVSYPAIYLCPLDKGDDFLVGSLVNDTLLETGEDIEQYVESIITATLDGVHLIQVPSPEILSLINASQYATIAASVYRQMSNKTLTTVGPWPVALDISMTEMGMCDVINSNVAPFDNPRYVYIQSPNDIILVGMPAMTYDEEGFLSFGAQMSSTRASKDLRSLSLSLRKCRFVDETNSRRYPVYTYNRCIMECRIKMIKTLCDCVPHFYKPLENEKVCNLAELKCLDDYRKEILTISSTNETLGKFARTAGLPKNVRECGCLDNCEHTSYLKDQEVFLPQALMNRLRISVATFPKVRITREMIFGFYDIFLRGGGVVNLCIGASVISVMEFIMTGLRVPVYELVQTLRCVYTRRQRAQAWKEKKDK